MCLKNILKYFFLRKSACEFCLKKETCSERLETIEMVHFLDGASNTVKNNLKKLEGLNKCKTDDEKLLYICNMDKLETIGKKETD